MFEAVGDPLGVVVETDLLVELQEAMIAAHDIESNAMLELSQANRTQVQGTRIVFVQMIGAV